MIFFKKSLNFPRNVKKEFPYRKYNLHDNTQTQVIFTIFLTEITAKKGQGMSIEREIKGA